MQGAIFQDDFLLFSIGKIDVVPGLHWLCPLENIIFNFRKLILEFEYQGKLLTVETSQFFVVKVKCAEVEPTGTFEPEQKCQSIPVTGLLEEYGKIFGEPKQLPLSMGVFDHQILII